MEEIRRRRGEEVGERVGKEMQVRTERKRKREGATLEALRTNIFFSFSSVLIAPA